jgi:hypothetical protein
MNFLTLLTNPSKFRIYLCKISTVITDANFTALLATSFPGLSFTGPLGSTVIELIELSSINKV